MTADLAEEHSTSTLATERLEAETADRLRLEKELQDVQVRRKSHVIFVSRQFHFAEKNV
jgi:myosin-18